MATALYAHVDPAPAPGIVSKVVEPLLALDDEALPRFSADLWNRLVKVPTGVEAAPGWTYDGAVFAPPAAPTGAILAALKADLKNLVDTKAEQLRLTYVTRGEGQQAEYAEAQAQAFAALANPSAATSALYPMLASTIGVDKDPSTGQLATDVLGVARSIQAAYDGWMTVGAAIRGARLKGKAAIMAAPTYADALAALTAIAWPPAA